MPQRLSYEESCRVLQREQVIDEGAIPPLPGRMPRQDDELMGVSFFRTRLADAKVENMTLPRTYFGRSEIAATSFQGTDLSESRANWNDFIEVDFSGADLSNSDLRGCLYERVKFRGTNLHGADLRYCGFKECDFSDAEMAGVKVTQKVGSALGLSNEQQSVIDWQDEDGEEPDGG